MERREAHFKVGEISKLPEITRDTDAVLVRTLRGIACGSIERHQTRGSDFCIAAGGYCLTGRASDGLVRLRRHRRHYRNRRCQERRRPVGMHRPEHRRRFDDVNVLMQFARQRIGKGPNEMSVG